MVKGKMKKIYIYPYASFEIKAVGKKNRHLFFLKNPKTCHSLCNFGRIVQNVIMSAEDQTGFEVPYSGNPTYS